jgi:hypothetical protein
MLDSDALNKAMMGLEAWKPDVVVAVDFGMTGLLRNTLLRCFTDIQTGTGVAYSAGPEWARPETIQHWPDATGTGLSDKVSTAISYDVETDQVVTWGFTVDPDNPNFRIEENFKLYLDPAYRDEFHSAPSLEEARRWFTDFLSCVYKSITQHFAETIPRWRMRKVEFVFSVPTTWKDPAMIAETEQLIRKAGFGKEHGHAVEISLTEAEAAAVYASKQQYEKGDVFLVCDAGGGTTDVNILKTAESNAGQIELEPLSCVEGQPIGSTLINFKVEKLITERLESIRYQLPAEPKKIAEIMMRTRFETFKCCFGTEAMNVSKLPLYVTGLPPGLNFPQAHIEDSRMIITTAELQNIFDEQIERIFQLIDGELKTLYNTHARENVSYLVLSGGLGSSPYVQKMLRRRYEEGAGNYPNAQNIQVLKAPKPQLAVVHGLIMDRVQRIKEDKLVYKERCCRNSYGILVRQLYDPQLHWREDIEKDPRDRKQWAINQIDWFIKKVSDPLPLDSMV